MTGDLVWFESLEDIAQDGLPEKFRVSPDGLVTVTYHDKTVKYYRWYESVGRYGETKGGGVL